MEEYLKKEMKIDEFVIIMEESESAGINGEDESAKILQLEEFDDVLFGFNISVKNNKSDPSGNQNNWDKEDEKVKKKLERISINSIKCKYAQ